MKPRVPDKYVLGNDQQQTILLANYINSDKIIYWFN